MSVVAFYLEFLALAVILFVGMTLALRLLERRFPRFSAWLDKHVGPEHDWTKPW